MTTIEILFLAFALGVDCCVVSFSQGLIFKSQRLKNSMLLALTMGFFQGFMPCIGYIGANTVHKYVAPFADILVFSIFLILGIKFIAEAFQAKEEKICCIGLKCLISLGIATSIDALVAGGSLNFSRTPLLYPALIIGCASFLMSLFGFWSGNTIKNFPSKYLEISGGIILITLALKTICYQ